MRFFKLTLRILTLLLLAAVAVPVLVVASLQVPAGRTLVSGIASTLASSPEQIVTIQDLHIGLDLDASVTKASLADATGVWLEADEIRMSWSPLTLLAGTLTVSAVSVEQLDLNRLPNAASAADGTTQNADQGSSSSARLPFNIDLQDLDIAEINLGETVLGTPVALSLKGAAAADLDPAVVSADLDVKRIDGINAYFTAKAEFAPAGGTLAFDVKVSEPRGGLAARMLDIPDLPAVDLTLTGSGPLDNWAADLDIALDGHQTAVGTATLATKAAARHLTFDLNGDLAPLAPPQAHAFLIGTTRATGQAVLALDFKPQSGAIDLQTETVKLSAKASASGSQVSADANLSVSAGSGALIALDLEDRRVTFGPMTAKLTARGRPENVDWSSSVHLASFETPDLRGAEAKLDLKGTGADLTAQGLTSPFDLAFTADGLKGLTPQTQFVSGALSASASGTFNGAAQSLSVAKLDVTSAFADTAFTDIKLSKDKVAGQGKLSLADLSILSELAGRTIAGALAATVVFDLDPANVTGTADLTATGHELKTGIAQADPFLRGKTDIAAKLQLTGPTSLTLTDLSVTNQSLSLSGSASYANGSLTSGLTAAFPDLALADPRIAGALELNAKTSGPVDRLEIAASMASEKILLSGTPLTGLTLNVDAIADPHSPSADIKGAADLNGQTVSIDLDLQSNDGGAVLDPLEVRLAGNMITGALTVSDLENPLETLSGALKINAPDLASISPLILTDLAGGMEGTLKADPDAGKLLLDLTGTDIDIPSLTLGTLKLKADLDRPYDPKTLSADLELSDLITTATPVRNAVVSAKPDNGGTALSANIKLEDGTSDGLTLSAFLSAPQSGAYELALNALSLNYQGIASQLKQPATLRYAAGTTQFSPLELALGQGSLSLSGSAGDALAVDAVLKAVPLSLVNAFVPDLGIGGTLSGKVTATGSSSAPTAVWSITGNGLTAAPLKENGLSVLALSSAGTLKNSQITQDTKITGTSGLSVSAAGTLGLDSAQAIAMTVQGTVPAAALRRPLLEAGLRADGGVTLSGPVSGSLQSPAYKLTAVPAGLRATSLSTGLTVQNIRGSASVTQDQASLNGIGGDLTTGGSFSASGTIGMKDGFAADLALTLDKARYIDPGLVTAEVDASISITGPLASPSGSPLIGGTVTINKADVSIPETLPGAISPVEVRHLHASAAVRRQFAELGGDKQKPSTEQRQTPPRLDVLISAPGRIFIRGRGLNAELEGNLKVVGTTADPQAIGAFSLRRGQFDILTRRLTFSYGRATFEGSLTPVLDFAATSTVNDTTITVAVTGEADNPEIKFTSSPELPQDEVLALLLFGKRVGNLSATQVAQLAAALTTLTGGSDSGPLAQIRKSLGLDSIDIDTSGEDGPSVSVGRYINDNIYLGVEQGTNSDSSRVKVDIDLDRGVKVRGEVGADGSSKAGIFFEREY